MDRRQFLAATAAAAGLAATPLDAATAQCVAARGRWASGELEHLLPTVDDSNILIKASFSKPLAAPPWLSVGGRRFRARATDTEGLFWSFHASGLEPGHCYTCVLLDASGHALCDAWPLKTFPSRDDMPRTFRALLYTCAGGDVFSGRYLPMPMRIRLLERGLSFEPDALVAIGDHIYWDQRSSSRSGSNDAAVAYAGRFERTLPVLGTANERVLKRAVGPQIADLYRTTCRSVPVFFFQDDHDHFDNDEADDHLVTFPPDWFNLSAARATQSLYYPEFLPDVGRPVGLASSSAADRYPSRLSESFGTLRYGKLVEMLLYDCRRHMSLAGASAGFVPPDVEHWLTQRMQAPMWRTCSTCLRRRSAGPRVNGASGTRTWPRTASPRSRFPSRTGKAAGARNTTDWSARRRPCASACRSS